MQRIIGSKIRQLREERGLTQEELAQSIGLSSEFISHLELGKRSPSLDSLSHIANFFGKKMSFFLPERHDEFAELSSRLGKEQTISKELKIFKDYCYQYIKLEEMTGRRLFLAPLYSENDAEKIAKDERRRLGMGNEPVRDIFTLIERNGLRVFLSPLPETQKIWGIFLFLEQQQAAFAWINSLLPEETQIFIAAHEYAHYIKDREDGVIIDNPDIFVHEYVSLYPGREGFAQMFASRFLMQPEKVEDILKNDLKTKKPALEHIFYLKRYFGISFLDTLYALKDMKMLSSIKYMEYSESSSRMTEEMIFRQGGKYKILAGKSRRWKSERFISLVLSAYRKKKINIREASRLLKIPFKEFQRMASQYDFSAGQS